MYVQILPAFRTIFRITGGFRNNCRVTGGYQKAGTRSLKRVSGRIFTRSKWFQRSKQKLYFGFSSQYDSKNLKKKHQVSFKKYCFDFQDLKIKQIKYSPHVPLLIICYPWTLVYCTEMVAEPPFRRGPLNILSLLLIALRMSSWVHQGWNVSFHPLVKNIGLKPAFQNDGFLSHLYVSVRSRNRPE